MEKYEVRNIKRAMVNGRQVKIFEVWETRNGANWFCGAYSAPAGTANKNLLKYYEEEC